MPLFYGVLRSLMVRGTVAVRAFRDVARYGLQRREHSCCDTKFTCCVWRLYRIRGAAYATSYSVIDVLMGAPPRTCRFRACCGAFPACRFVRVQ